MPDLSITVPNVVPGANAQTRQGVAGVLITAGQICRINPADGKYVLADADAAGVGSVTRFFLALHSAATNQPLTALVEGDVTLGAVMTAGTSYYVSPVPGGIAPRADILAGDNVILLGVSRSTSVLVYRPLIPGVTL